MWPVNPNYNLIPIKKIVLRSRSTDRSDRSDNFDYNKNGYTIWVLLDLLMRTVWLISGLFSPYVVA